MLRPVLAENLTNVEVQVKGNLHLPNSIQAVQEIGQWFSEWRLLPDTSQSTLQVMVHGTERPIGSRWLAKMLSTEV